MKSILVPITNSDNLESALAAAVSVARRNNSYVEAYYAHPLPQIFVGDAFGMGVSYSGDLSNEWLALKRRAHAAFTQFMEQNAMHLASMVGPQGAPAAGWHDAEGKSRAAVGEYGRLFDMIVIGQQSNDGGIVTAICEEALFESGRPILLAPQEPVKDFGQSILIAWNGSTETARTIGLGIEFIEKAKHVHVLTVESGTVPGPTGEQVANHLRLRGISVEANTIKPSHRTIGEAILHQASESGADLIFKGAYTHSRLRQMVFGGPTRHIMSESKLPVYMAH